MIRVIDTRAAARHAVAVATADRAPHRVAQTIRQRAEHERVRALDAATVLTTPVALTRPQPGGAVTVSVALLLVTEPFELVTTTSKKVPESDWLRTPVV